MTTRVRELEDHMLEKDYECHASKSELASRYVQLTSLGKENEALKAKVD